MTQTASQSMQLILTPKVTLVAIAYTAPIAIAANGFGWVKKTSTAIDAD